MSQSKKNVPVLEELFVELEELVAKLELDKLSLEESFDLYNKGISLVKNCNQSIDTIEKKVMMLGTGGELEEF